MELTDTGYIGLSKMPCPSIQMVDCPRTKHGKLLQNKNLVYISVFYYKVFNIHVQKHLNTSPLLVTLFTMELFLLDFNLIDFHRTLKVVMVIS